MGKCGSKHARGLSGAHRITHASTQTCDDSDGDGDNVVLGRRDSVSVEQTTHTCTARRLNKRDDDAMGACLCACVHTLCGLRKNR